MAGKAFLQRLGAPRNTRNSRMAQAHADSDHTSSTAFSAGFDDNASAPSSSTPSNTSTPTKSKNNATPTSTPKSKKRKSRTAGYGDESDSDYRAHSSSRKSSRRTRRASFESDPDGDYGGSMTPTRKMTRPILSRYSYKKLISSANGEADEEDGEEDEREGLCLEKCPFYENQDMIECDRYQCGRKFHLGCVGFSAKPTLGENKWWFCLKCREIEERGMKTNGIYAMGDSEDEDEEE